MEVRWRRYYFSDTVFVNVAGPRSAIGRAPDS